MTADRLLNIPLSDDNLKEFNRLLDWRAAAALPDGRMLGQTHAHKRANVNKIPDNRITRLNQYIDLNGARVLEIGCFEGIHTLGLMQYGADMTAVDVRPVNVLKTLARISAHGGSARVFVQDGDDLDPALGSFDVIFHFGVLYHLTDPVTHLIKLGARGDVLYLDTHVAPADEKKKSYVVDGQTYEYVQRGEGGWADPFSGPDNYSIHLTSEALSAALAKAGFTRQNQLSFREERNGPRVTILAVKDGVSLKQSI